MVFVAVTADHRGDRRAPVAALRSVAVVPQPGHQRFPRLGDLADAPPGARRLAGEPEARKRRADDMKSIFDASTVCGRVGERLNDLVELDD
jgi:hypothetical protein